MYVYCKSSYIPSTRKRYQTLKKTNNHICKKSKKRKQEIEEADLRKIHLEELKTKEEGEDVNE